MAVIGEAFVEIKAKTDNFKGDAESSILSSVKGIAAAAGGAIAAAKIFDFGKGAFDAAIESQKIAKQSEAVIKSTGGAAQITAQQIGDLATAISNKTGVDDEAIQTGENLLLTFTNVQNKAGEGNDIFNQSTKLMVDMAAAMGTDASGGAIQLGKALNDPVAGITALTRVGVSFTQEQKDQIKTMVESGDTLGAQKIILGELTKEFGGSAEAQATATDKMKVAFGNMQEQIGGLLIPIVEKFSNWMVAEGIPAMQSFIAGIQPAAEVWLPRLSAAIGFVVDHWQLFAAAILILGGPITATVAAIALVVANLDTFRGAIDSVMTFVNGVLDVAQAFWRTWGDAITQIVMGAFTIIQGIIESTMSVIEGIINVVMGLIHGDWSQVWEGIRQIVDGVWIAITTLVQGALSILSGIIGGAMTLISGIFDAAWAAILALLGAVWSAITSLISTAMAGITAGLSAAWAGIQALFTGALDGIQAAITTAFAWVVDQVTQLPGRIVALLGMFVDAGVQLIEGFWNGLRNVIAKMDDMVGVIIGALASLPGKVAGVATDAGFYITAAIGEGLRFIVDRLATLGSDIITFLVGLPGRVYGEALSIGSAILNAIVDGVGDVGGAIWNKISGGIASIPGKVGSIIGSINPFASGGNIVPGFASGGDLIPHYGSGGTRLAPGGLAVVGERGPELVQFGGSAAIFPNNVFQDQLVRALQAAGGGGNGSIININVMLDNVSMSNANDVGRVVATSAAQTLQAMGIGIGVRQAAGR